MEYEQRKPGRVRQPEPLLPVLTPAQQTHQRKVFQGYAQEQEAAPARQHEQQRQALPGQIQAFTRLAESGSAHVQRQRQRAAPVLQAAGLQRQDDLAVQRTQDQLSTVQRSVQASGKTLSAYGLAPAGPLDVIQLQREEDRQAARVPVAPLPLSPVQRQALMQHASDEIGSALTRDARYLPAAGRADVAHAAVQRFAQQGLDREALRDVMVQRAPDSNTRESVTQLLTAQRRQDTQAQEDKEERGLLLGHHQLQRQLQDAQAEHDGQQGQSLSERVQARVGAGAPLPTEVRRQLERGLNADLSRVRIHDDAEADKLAKSIQAVAFTSGQNIFFRAGQYQPNTQTGMALLLHEGTHTVQQARGQAKPGIDADAGLEQEAVANEGKVAMLPTLTEPSSGRMAASQSAGPLSAVQRRASGQQPQVSGLKGQSLQLAERFTVYLRSSTNTAAVDNLYIKSLNIDGLFAPEKLDQTGVCNLVWSHFKEKKLDQQLITYLKQNGSAVYRHFINLLSQPQNRETAVKAIGGQQQLTFDAFIEQLSDNLVYANRDDFKDDKSESKGGALDGTGAALLKAFKYASSPVFLGNWGFQMRVFYPLPGSPYKQVILAFRGTEGIAFPRAVVKQLARVGTGKIDGRDFAERNESEQDTATDLSPQKTAVTMYNANQDLVSNAIRFAHSHGGPLLVTGHSLGGGLAQLAAARHPGVFGQLYTFQSPGISPEGVDRIEQSGTTARNYRMTIDAVPTANQGRFPGAVHTFEDPEAPHMSINTVKDNHLFPMLNELIGSQERDGVKLSPAQKALLKYGKHANGTADHPKQVRSLGDGQQVPIFAGEASKVLVTGLFAGINANTVANNLIYNILMEKYKPQLIALTLGVVRSNQKDTLRLALQSISDLAMALPLDQIKMDEEGAAAVRDYLGVDPNITDLGAAIDVVPASPLIDVATFGVEGKMKAFAILKAIRTGRYDDESKDILLENKNRFHNTLPQQWYAHHPEGATELRAVLTGWPEFK